MNGNIKNTRYIITLGHKNTVKYTYKHYWQPNLLYIKEYRRAQCIINISLTKINILIQ